MMAWEKVDLAVQLMRENPQADDWRIRELACRMRVLLATTQLQMARYHLEEEKEAQQRQRCGCSCVVGRPCVCLCCGDYVSFLRSPVHRVYRQERRCCN